jgi:hypothetical protein
MQKMFDNMDTDDSGSVSKVEWLLVGHPEAR